MAWLTIAGGRVGVEARGTTEVYGFEIDIRDVSHHAVFVEQVNTAVFLRSTLSGSFGW